MKRFCIALAFFTFSAESFADTETWTGANDTNWTTAQNWGEIVDGASVGDDLIFPQLASRKTNHNNFAVNDSFSTLSFDGNGYLITGNQIFLTGGIDANVPAGTPPQFSPNIVVDGIQNFDSLGATNYELNGVVNLLENDVFLNGTGGHRFDGTITSTPGIGQIIKNGSGTAVINSDSPIYGTTRIQGGVVEVNGAVGNVLLSGGTLAGEGTVRTIDALANGGAVSPGRGVNDPGILDVVAGVVDLGTNVTFFVDINGANAGTQYDRLNVTSNNIGLNDADLSLTLGFTPTNGQKFEIVRQDGTGQVNGEFVQGTNIVTGGQIFTISYSLSNVVLTALGSTLTWTGAGANSNWSTVANWNPAFVPTNGLDLVFPDGAARKTNFNNIANNSSFGSLTFNGNGYVINGNQFFLEAGLSNNVPAGTPVDFNADIILGTSQTFTAVSSVPCILGHVNLSGESLTLNGAGVHRFDGLVNGSGAINKNDAGTAVLNGISPLLGTLQINAGTVEVNGLIGAVGLSSGTLAGTGTVGTVSTFLIPAGVIAPGQAGTTNAGILRVDGIANLDSNTTFEVDLNGATAGTQYDRLVVTNNNVLLDDAILDVSLGFTPTNGQKFTIVQQDGPGTLTGQFAQGTLITAGGKLFGISYTASNAVMTVLAVDPVPVVTSFNLQPGATSVVVSGTNGNPATSYSLLATTNIFLPTTNWQVIASNVFDGAGNFAITNAVDPVLPRRFMTIRNP